MRRAVEEPLKQIAVNAGLEGGVVVEKVKTLPAGQGLNAATGEYVDMFKSGVIDPAKVTRSALQNAASIAALFLTTEAVVAEKPEKEKAPAAPGGGDMDFSTAAGAHAPGHGESERAVPGYRGRPFACGSSSLTSRRSR